MWWALCVSRGLNLRWLLPVAGPDCCGYLNGPNHFPPPIVNEWMALSGPPRFSWVNDGGDDDAVGPKPQRSHRRRRSRSIEDDEEGHLIYHSGDMLRARCIEYTLFCIFSFLSLFIFCCGVRLILHAKFGVLINSVVTEHLGLSWCVYHQSSIVLCSSIILCIAFQIWVFQNAAKSFERVWWTIVNFMFLTLFL